METRTVVGIIALLFASAAFMTVVYYVVFSRNRGAARSILGSMSLSGGRMSASQLRERLQDDPTGKELEKLKNETRRRQKKKIKPGLDELFFHAGIFSDQEKREFMRVRLLAPFLTAPICAFGMYSFGMGNDFVGLGVVLGVLLGMQLPKSILDRKIKARGDEILYYLPLVIEQIAIGVSSSLDIGPCIAKVISMADERDSHNVVTELMRHANYYVKSGASLDHALGEVGKLSGSSELKHAFMALSQVVRHGGEITRQLQELADSVSTQRETKIEGKIKQLELEATGPVAMVFAGFLIILLIGFGIQLQNAF